MPHIFFSNKTFFCEDRKILKIVTWQTYDVFVQQLILQLIWTTFIFWPPMLLIKFISISNMECH